ncbi:MAG TPA: SGNH/GDSL hydrolase family protein [Planctomycetota bacterium]|nr:SGNH/GDSL hydrolase family protein [Planctomycetota bacterium]
MNPPPAPTRGPRLHTKLAWCVLAPLIAMAGLEFVVVALDIAPPRARPLSVWNADHDEELDSGEGDYRFHDGWLWEPRPGATLYGDVVNADGLRGEPVPREPRPGLRIAALGESVTFGMRVRAADAWPAVLERLLRERGLDAQVLDFGVTGHTIAQGRELYLQRVSAWRPDVLIACFPGVNESAPKSDGLDDLDKIQLVQRPAFRLRIYLDRFASVRWLASLLGGHAAPSALSQAPASATVTRLGTADFTKVIGQLREDTRDRGCSLLLVSAARSRRGETAQPELLEYTTALEGIAAELAIPVADVRGAFASAPVPESLLYLDTWHPTPQGHWLYALTILDALERGGALGSAGSR